MALVPERSFESELMDRPDNSPGDIRDALCDISRVNRLAGGRRAILSALRPFVVDADPGATLEVLDVGTGGADLPRDMVRLAEESGRKLRVTAVDREYDTAAIAAEWTRDPSRVRVVCADAFRLPFTDGSFDVVTASMFLHHFRHEDIVRLLAAWRGLARKAVLINDLRRHLLPWAFIAATVRLTRRQRMFRHDAPLSVLRGFTKAELQQAAGESGAAGSVVRRSWPFRLVATLPAAEQAS